jgi:hypothetical protein
LVGSLKMASRVPTGLEKRELWDFPVDEDPAVLTLGHDRLGDLISGVEAIARGRGDYSIGGTAVPSRPSTELWLWWYVPPNKPLERTGAKPCSPVDQRKAGRSLDRSRAPRAG